jgi:hypothetical protein
MRKSAQAKVTHTQPKNKEKTGLKSKESLAEVQKALKAAQAEAKRERQARIRAEKALIEVQERFTDIPLEPERNSQPDTRRVSFVVRLTFDEQGQFGWTEIEHVSSGRKKKFLSLEGDLLVAFMTACITHETSLEDTTSTKPR